MQIFKYNFTKLITALIYAGIVLAVAAAGVNTYILITEGLKSALNPLYPILQYTLIYIVAALAIVLLVSLLISSYYAVGDKKFITSFGIIKSKYDIEKIESIILDRNTNKLAVHFADNTFIVIVVKSEWHEKFIDALLKENEKIEYTVQSKESDTDDKKKS